MPKNDEPLKLNIELVPSSSWYDNLRNLISPKNWEGIRKNTYENFDHNCGICGSEGRLNCHEIWEYDDTVHIQRLEGFIALCNMCHFIKHLGYAGILADEGKLDYDSLIEHFIKVNNCDKKTFNKHRDIAFKQWRKRSKYEWKIDLGVYRDIVKKKTKS